MKSEFEKYFLVYDDSEVIGVTGFYSNDDLNETNSIWLGWIGILEKYRSKGMEKVLYDTIEMTRKLQKN